MNWLGDGRDEMAPSSAAVPADATPADAAPNIVRGLLTQLEEGIGSWTRPTARAIVAEVDKQRATIASLHDKLDGLDADYGKLCGEYEAVSRERAAAEQEIQKLRRLLRTATTRLEILRDRMEACDAGDTTEQRHALSLFEIPHWIDEQRAALTPE